MIFAAGRGKRMAPLTDTTPKPLIPVSGKPLIDHALALSDSFERIIVNTHYLAEAIAQHLRGTGVTTVFEEVLLETGGGLRNALPLLGPGPVATLNCDAVWRGPNVLDDLVRSWETSPADALLSVVAKEQALGHKGKGDFTLGIDGQIRRGPALVYTGAQIITTDQLWTIKETAFSMNVIWDRMIAAGTLYGQPYPGTWCDVGQPDSIPLAESLCSV